MVSTLSLPRLPVGGWSDLQFQVWWQTVVERVEESVNELNTSVDALLNAETSIAQLEMNSAALSAQMLNGARVIGELVERIALLQAQVDQLQAANKKLANANENTELMAWQL